MDAPNASPALPDGVLLAEIDGVQYVQITGVFTLAAATLAYYGPAEAWADSPAWQEAARRQRVAELRAELARLEALPAPALPQLPAPVATPVASPRVPCPECGHLCKANGLVIHRRKKHGIVAPAEPAPAEPAPAPEPVALVVPPRPAPARPALLDGEACPKAHFKTFAASVSLPHRCVRCTGEFEQATRRAA